jgi:hypothetical protein
MWLLSLFCRGSPPQKLNAVTLCVIAGVLIPIFTCGDSFSKFPIHAVINVNPRDSARIIDLSHVYYDAVTSASLRVDSGFISAKTCTLYLFMRYANGNTAVFLSRRPYRYDLIDTISRPPYCLDSTEQNIHIQYVFSNLIPNTKYFFQVYGDWYTGGGSTPRNWWGLDSIQFTTTDTVNTTASP